MKPIDVFHQLVGDGDEFDEISNFGVAIDNPSKFPDYQQAAVDFEQGTVVLMKLDSAGDILEEKKYSIKAELVEYEEPDKETID